MKLPFFYSNNMTDGVGKYKLMLRGDIRITLYMICLAKPSVVQRVRKVDCSLSDGEAPLSPGDARWNTLHKGKLNEKKKKG